MEDPSDSIRLDKWLWVARLYKTRVLAQAAIVSGKVRYNQKRAKPCTLVENGAEISIQHQAKQKTIIVKSLSEKRYSLQTTSRLYEEVETIRNLPLSVEDNDGLPYPPLISTASQSGFLHTHFSEEE